jgi:hypothetical protein
MLTRYYPTGKGFTRFPNPCNILSIDPGSTNFGMRIESRYINTEGKTGTNLIFMEVLNFNPAKSKDADLTELDSKGFSAVITDIINTFDSAIHLFKSCSIIIIEEQLSKQNPKMSIICTELLVYFLLRLEKSRLNPIIYMVHTQYVKKYLQIDGKKTEKKKKKHIISAYTSFLFKRARDEESLKKLSEYKKADQLHLTDSAAQIEAICHEEDYPTIAAKSESLEFIETIK